MKSGKLDFEQICENVLQRWWLFGRAAGSADARVDFPNQNMLDTVLFANATN